MLILKKFILTFFSVWLNDTVSDDSRPGKEAFCKGRKNKKNYTAFFLRFVPAVVGPEIFRQRLQDANGDTSSSDTVCTISDEAFALLLVENSYDRWTDIYKKTGGIPKQRRGDRTRQCDSDIAPQYTHGGIRYLLHQSTKSKGWTTTGIERYNALFQMVQKDRQRRPNFIKKFIKEQQVSSSKKKEKKELVAVTAVHLLWDDEVRKPTDTSDETVPSDDSSHSSDDTATADIAPVKV